MNADLIAVLEYMERDKGISREVLIQAIESSLLTASKKCLGPARNMEVAINPKSGDIKAYTMLVVVEAVTDLHNEISLSEARKLNPDAAVGEEIRKEVTPKNFGRIAAQTAKQVVIQKIREAEKDVVMGEYRQRVGEIVSGVIRRAEKGVVVIDLGRTEGIMPEREQCPHEEYRPGMRVRALILEVREKTKNPEVILSRATAGFVRKLFEIEVPEFGEKVVEMKAIAREPGYRTKLAVWAQNDKIDCVGACVGLRGARVKSVVRELSGEKVDIIRWDPNPVIFITNALSPAKIKQVTLDEGKKEAEVVVDEDQLSLAIGKKGQNVRLASHLTGWKVDIFREGEISKGVKKAVGQFSALPEVGEEIAQKLVEAGFTGLAVLAIADPSDLAEIPGLDEVKAGAIITAAKELIAPKDGTETAGRQDTVMPPPPAVIGLEDA
ncbi:MAG: transcription termination factor NusA [Candidatus Aureabacteria bacterium]|nr:transcription termination factor NusA [Candidatus Auribacterota bacterium]